MSIKVYPASTLGIVDHGWLKARHHFSFGTYHNPARMNFGALRVINDDEVQPGTGFGTHGHQNMEIITYVRNGSVTHRDSMNNTGITKAGDLQVMSAGAGVLHSEHNESNTLLRLFQIWIVPNKLNVQPRWEAMQFPDTAVANALPILVSGMQEHMDLGALFIYQDAAIYGGKLEPGTMIKHPIKHQAYVLISEGEITINGIPMQARDGAEVTVESTVEIAALTATIMLVIDAPEV